MSANRILLLAVAGIALSGLAAELRAADTSVEIAMKEIEGVNIENLPHAAKVIIVGDHPEVAQAFEAAGINVEIRSEGEAAKSAKNPEKPDFSAMKKTDLQAYLASEPNAVIYETDANVATLRKLAEDKFLALQAQA